MINGEEKNTQVEAKLVVNLKDPSDAYSKAHPVTYTVTATLQSVTRTEEYSNTTKHITETRTVTDTKTVTDTVATIAQKFKITREALVKENGLGVRSQEFVNTF